MSREQLDGGSLEWHGNEFFFLATRETVKAMKKGAIYLQGVVKETVGGTGSGRLYKRGKSKGSGRVRVAESTGSADRRFATKTHQASAAGDPPARDMGILASSISYEVKQRGPVVNAFVGADDAKNEARRPTTDPDYALFLELGTPNMAPRPYLRPSLIKATPKIVGFIRKAL